jgi:hypothetical protein
MFNQHAAWRYLLMTGLIPAIPIALMLPFVPESQAWRERRLAGTLKRPSFAALFAPELRRVTLVTAALSACAYAGAFGALQITPRSIVPGLKELASQEQDLAPLRAEAGKLNADLDQIMPAVRQALGDLPGLEELTGKRAKNRISFRAAVKAGESNVVATLGSEFKDLGTKLDEITAGKLAIKQTVLEREKLLKAIGDNRDKQLPFSSEITARGNSVQLAQEIGGFAGRVLLALLLFLAIAKRSLLRIFVVPGLLVLPVTYFLLYHSTATAFSAGIFLCGLLIVGQFSYFGEYLPKAFPLHLRGTGGSFSTNVGGRMIGTSAAFLSTNIIAPLFAEKPAADHYALAAGVVGAGVFALAFALSFFLPEPKAEKTVE